MTAEIIQFGKPLSSPAQLGARRNESIQRRVKPEAESEFEAVRCTVDGKLYEVVFRGASVCDVSALHYRHRAGRGDHIETIRHRHRRELDPVIVEAARRARGRSGTERETAIAQLRDRHARLLRQAEKVETTIAILQREIN